MLVGGPLPHPESGWEQSSPGEAAIEALVARAIARWPDLGAEAPVLLGGGLRSANLRFGDRVARFALAPDHDLAKEAALLRLVEGEVRVPRVLDGDADALLLEHVAHEELPASSQAGARAGRAAARIHAHRFGASGFLDGALAIPEPFPSAYDGLRSWGDALLAGRAGGRLGALAERVKRLWDGAETTLRAVADAPALVHADFKPANVKWLPAVGDVLVLDWEFAWSGPPLMDVGQMLRWGAPGAFVAGFVRGYRDAGGTLPDGWRRTAEVLDLFHLVGLLEGPEERPRRQADVVRRIEQTLRTV